MSSEVTYIVPENSSPGTALIHSIAMLQHTQIVTSSGGHSLLAIAEFPLGYDDKKEIHTVLAVVQYKGPSNKTYPPSNSFCYICSKTASITHTTALPQDVEQDMIDFVIDAFFMHRLNGKQIPHAPFVTVVATSGQVDGDRQFYLDVLQPPHLYIMVLSREQQRERNRRHQQDEAYQQQARLIARQHHERRRQTQVHQNLDASEIESDSAIETDEDICTQNNNTPWWIAFKQTDVSSPKERPT
ncbi:hypothetical protein M422DRAFT_268539 [Sphaerobolus stellatus SS14]|uniref:Uncharacterized protein n=1 Tax=Sphaerobolus stellatus (strain SS14) TaxID=990650 RepID=A0A0C9TJX2_SPHS4|nr:hypothetical protein M422DRAFT_268539 [Sphaerobolus stellatus SS14]